MAARLSVSKLSLAAPIFFKNSGAVAKTQTYKKFDAQVVCQFWGSPLKPEDLFRLLWRRLRGCNGPQKGTGPLGPRARQEHNAPSCALVIAPDMQSLPSRQPGACTSRCGRERGAR